jgi:hypothetical protein
MLYHSVFANKFGVGKPLCISLLSLLQVFGCAWQLACPVWLWLAGCTDFQQYACLMTVMKAIHHYTKSCSFESKIFIGKF